MERLVPRVVIVGAGFGGLQCARKLRGEAVDVVLIDAENYHLFTPLLYQVASCLLNPGEIAAPLRKTFRGARNVRLRRGLVIDVDLDARRLTLDDGVHVEFDHLVLAAGSRTTFYGNHELARHALGLKDLGEALQLRNHVLDCLERAAVTADAAERRRRLTFCIVGGGPTGVEYAGALAELVRLVLPAEYPELNPADVRIFLLEGGDRLLPSFRKRLSAYALRELRARGVRVRLNALVKSATDEVVETHSDDRIETASMVWTAGVQPSELTRNLEVPHAKSGRIEVDERLRVPGFDHVYAIGDAALTRDKNGRELPMTSPPAMQAGRYVARQILDPSRVRPFRYFDKGTLATIGRTSAVGQVGPFQFTGFLGWIVWLVVHLYYLIGFENRVTVMLRWSWYYFRYDRPIRAAIWAHRPLDERR